MKHAAVVVPIILFGVLAGSAYAESIVMSFYVDYQKICSYPLMDLVPTYTQYTVLFGRFCTQGADLNGGFIDLDPKSHLQDYPQAQYPEEYGTDGQPFDALIHLVGNGMPDSQFELGLPAEVLKNESIEIPGGASHTATVNAWHANQAGLAQIFGTYWAFFNAAAPELIEVLIGYLTVGDGAISQTGNVINFSGSGGFSLALLELWGYGGVLEGNPLAPGLFTKLPQWFGKTGDADGDGDSNFDEYSRFHQVLPTDTAAQIAAKGAAYVADALNPAAHYVPPPDLMVDTDGGGVSDGIEEALGTNPLDPSDDRFIPVENSYTVAILIALTAALGLRQIRSSRRAR